MELRLLRIMSSLALPTIMRMAASLSLLDMPAKALASSAGLAMSEARARFEACMATSCTSAWCIEHGAPSYSMKRHQQRRLHANSRMCLVPLSTLVVLA